MPTTTAVVYRWNELPFDAPMALLKRQRIIGDKMMISNVFLQRGCDVPLHSHENEQITYMLSGKLRFGIGAVGSPDRRELTLSAGDVLHLPSNVPHSAYALEDSQVLDLFSPPSATTGIDRNESTTARTSLSTPATH